MKRKDCEHMSMAETQLELLPEQLEMVIGGAPRWAYIDQDFVTRKNHCGSFNPVSGTMYI